MLLVSPTKNKVVESKTLPIKFPKKNQLLLANPAVMHKKPNQATQQRQDPKSEQKQALSKVFSCPNLPLYIYFKNWNYLINSEMFHIYKPNDKDIYCWKQELQKLGKFNMHNPYAKFQVLYDRINENPNRVTLQKNLS